MKQWIIKTPEPHVSVSVVADRVFYADGYVKFFNNKQPGQQYGETVAVFAPGQWLYVKAAEGSV